MEGDGTTPPPLAPQPAAPPTAPGTSTPSVPPLGRVGSLGGAVDGGGIGGLAVGAAMSSADGASTTTTAAHVATARDMMAGVMIAATGTANPAEAAAAKLAEFWAKHKAWADSVRSQPLEVSVSDPATSGSFVSSYTTYKVMTTPQGWVVRRRFSDFDWLRQMFHSRYVGIVLPPLPEKKSFGKTDPAFVRTRMRALRMFITTCALNPYLKSDRSFLMFLNAPDRDWDDEKKSSSKSAGDHTSEEHWRAAVDKYQLPMNTDKHLVDVQRHLDTMEPIYRDLISSAKRLADKAEAFCKEIALFKASYEVMAQAESRLDLSALSSSASHSHTEYTKLLTLTGQGVTAWAGIVEMQPLLLSAILLETLKFEAGQIAGFKDVLKQRGGMVDAHQRALRQLEKHTTELDTLRARGGREDKIAKMEKNIHEDKLTAQRAEYVLQFMTKGLFMSELDRLGSEKMTLIRDMFGQLSATGAAYASKLSTLWCTMTKSLKVDPAEQVQKARKALEHAKATSEGHDGGGAGGGGGGGGSA